MSALPQPFGGADDPEDRDDRIRPIDFQPPGSRRPRAWRKLRLVSLALGAVLLSLLGGVWFVFTARSLTLVFEPEAETVSIRGGLSIPLGTQRLLRPGTYVVVAERSGFHRFERQITVGPGPDPTFRFELAKLPGILRVLSKPAPASVSVDREPVGETPLESVEIEPGRRRILVRADRHQDHETEVEIEGKGVVQTLDVALVPAFAAVTFRTEPPGASVAVDGKAQGLTPLTAEVGAGTRSVSLSLAGYEPWQRELEVVAAEPQTLATVELERARGRLRLTSEPPGANVSVGGEFRGRTPLTVALAPEERTKIQLTRAGYESAVREVAVPAGEEQPLAVELRPILATLRVRAAPEDALVYVDGEARGAANQELSLTAAPHQIEIRKPGYVSYRTTVTPKPGFVQEVTATLANEAEPRGGSAPRAIASPAGPRLVLVSPGRFTMGSPRREQGRRGNEVERDVVLTRAFYIGVHEVTNRDFRAFRGSHSSGIVEQKTLDNDDMPVVRVSWEDSIAYCNWLSERERLPPAYQGGTLRVPIGTGYRLPTEAEWAFAARFAGGRSAKYSWGDRMPPAGSAGNYADASAAALVAEHLLGYDDGFAASAPVGRFAANALGLFDLGGNVSEWVNDRYETAPGLSAAVETDPVGPATGSTHAIRGSSWRHGRITELRFAYREAGAGPRDDLGFRVARYAK